MRRLIELFFNKGLKVLAELILPLKNDVLLGGMHVDVDLLCGDVDREVNEVRVAAFGLEERVCLIDDSLDLVRLDQPVVDEQQQVRLLGLHDVWLAEDASDVVLEVLQVLREVNEVFACLGLSVSLLYDFNP